MYTNISNKIEQLSYKDEYGTCGHTYITVLTWAIDKWLHINHTLPIAIMRKIIFTKCTATYGKIKFI